MFQRGLLITLLLIKDSDPKITLAIFKAKVNYTKSKEALIDLHERKFIDWSGYKAAKKSVDLQKISPDVLEAVDFMNNLYGRNFDSSSKSTVTGLSQRLQEHNLETIKKVIANRYREWKDDPIMSKHLNPQTIFRPSKFEKYLEEVNRTKVGESIVSANQLNLNDGDEITYEISKNLSDNDIYTVKTYLLDSNEELIGSGMIQKLQGKALIRLIKLGHSAQKFGDKLENKYFYIKQ
ncbi:hypothetical protein CGPG_00036 [Cellulophaga phage phiST]|uniref:Phage conserved hypothetical protein C-terminal domain-containing protein n=1 Tax=Cellulophaga phage phiST TaxID=756282 RepID=M4SN88_9CAUD|nr:hypothetical protein CGPG_00036 [Cellulophaga phage phiST]AGH56735.1 hypothetical protein CGPG_00036 [Cellulophaga phage phiST]